MQRFSALFTRLDGSTATSAKVDALAAYFAEAPREDAAWALHFLTGGKLKRAVSSTVLRELCVRASGYPSWLIDESYSHVGDLAETIALLTSGTGEADSIPLHEWVARLRELATLPPEERDARILSYWATLSDTARFLLDKLLTGELRVGVSQRLVVQALAKLSGLPTEVIAHRLTAMHEVSAAFLDAVLAPADEAAPALADRPYPFFLATQLDGDPAEQLGARDDWLAELKWDGIRAQLIRRAGTVTLWSRGEERLDGRFPEIEQAATMLPGDVVLDGEILAWRGDEPLPFNALQKRIGRLKPGAKLLGECPVAFMAYDLLERDGVDLRDVPLDDRRARLADVVAATASPTFRISPAVMGGDWAALAAERARARELSVEGLILKRRTSTYQVGRKRGDWYKWKIEPHTIDAVLVYAQAGHGRRAGLYTDYTFAVWDGDALVPVAKAYSGLTDQEIGKLDAWIRANTTEKFGPVRQVKAHHVFELAFEGVLKSTRHKSGVAVRFPRILRWRVDKPMAEADTLAALQALAAG